MSAKSSKVKHEVKDSDIALMQTHKGWWLKVGNSWWCIINTEGEVINTMCGDNNNYATTGAKFYKPLSDILKEVPLE